LEKKQKTRVLNGCLGCGMRFDCSSCTWQLSPVAADIEGKEPLVGGDAAADPGRADKPNARDEIMLLKACPEVKLNWGKHLIQGRCRSK
jgi:hypothetical protein